MPLKSLFPKISSYPFLIATLILFQGSKTYALQEETGELMGQPLPFSEQKVECVTKVPHKNSDSLDLSTDETLDVSFATIQEGPSSPKLLPKVIPHNITPKDTPEKETKGEETSGNNPTISTQSFSEKDVPLPPQAKRKFSTIYCGMQ